MKTLRLFESEIIAHKDVREDINFWPKLGKWAGKRKGNLLPGYEGIITMGNKPKFRMKRSEEIELNFMQEKIEDLFKAGDEFKINSIKIILSRKNR